MHNKESSGTVLTMNTKNQRNIYTGEGHAHFITFGTSGKRKVLGIAHARQIVISTLSSLTSKYRLNVCGFVIMPDHVHALFWLPDDLVLPDVMRVWKSTSAHWLRKYYERTNPDFINLLKTRRNGRELICFWQRRYYDFNVKSSEKAREKLDYMHNNPVKKGLCKYPEDWIWSSARWYKCHRSVGVDIVQVF